jgi:hypothetical protein
MQLRGHTENAEEEGSKELVTQELMICMCEVEVGVQGNHRSASVILGSYQEVLTDPSPDI